MAWNLHALRKSPTDKCLDGICGGLGEFTRIPSWLWRVAFVLCAYWSGYAIGVYFLLMLFMPGTEQPVIGKPAVEQPEAGIAN